MASAIHNRTDESSVNRPEEVKIMSEEYEVGADGAIICFDCEENFPKEAIFGDPRWSDPRCGDCYDSHKYGR
jgi:hypothetical protein